MSFDATLTEPPALADSEESDALDPRIVRAEERLCMMRELAELGMDLTRALVRQNLEPPDVAPGSAQAAARSAARRDPADAFARLSRAVRLTLALEAKADDDLAALRAGPVGAAGPNDFLDDDPVAPHPKGGLPGLDFYRGAYRNDYVEAGVELELFNARPLPRDYPSAFRNKVRDSIYAVMNHEISDPDQAREARDDLYERLWDGERYDVFVHRPLKEAVEAICQDLGLNPDWGLWNGEGWNYPPDSQARQWERRWILNGSMKPKPRVYRWGPLHDPPKGGASP